MKRECGGVGLVYLLRNVVNDKCYVGQTIRLLEARWAEHIREAFHRKKPRTVVARAIRKHGLSNFTAKVLWRGSLNLLDSKEVFYIHKFRCMTPTGYNLTPGGFGSKALTPAIRKKISKTCSRTMIAYYAENGSPMKGRKFTAEHRANMRGPKAPEHYANMCHANKNMSAEHCAAISAGLQGYRPSQSCINAAVKARKGISLTASHRANLAAAARRQWAEGRGWKAHKEG
jgi:group I intron endonuclease